MKRWIITGLLLLATVGIATADYGIMEGPGLRIAGDLTTTFRALDRNATLNTNSHGDDPFDPIRVRMFLLKDWDSTVKMNVEFLWDNGNNVPPRIQGAYFTFTHFLGPISAKVGLIPSTIGNYGQRSTYFNLNPVIGVPAFWHYRTSMNINGSSTNSNIKTGYENSYPGTNLAYDACWCSGVEFIYNPQPWKISLGVAKGATDGPFSVNNGYMKSIRISEQLNPSFLYGISYANSNWIKDDPQHVTLPKNTLDYYQNAYNAFFEYSFGHWEFYGEGIYSRWDAPFIREGSVNATSGYVDGKWSFIPGWYWGFRVDRMQFNKISMSNDGTGPSEPWAYDFSRFETSINWRVMREGFIRLDYQGTHFEDEDPMNIQMMALSFQFAF